MARQPLTLEMSTAISQRAVQLARQNMARRGWSDASRMAIEAAPTEGKVGIRATAKHLVFQNKGIRPFLMTALEGKTVPINGKLFRVKGVGLPGMGFQNRKGNPVKGSIWRQQRWRHPGIKPQGFLENSIKLAMMENQASIRHSVIDQIQHPTPNTVMAANARARARRSAMNRGS